MNYNLVFFRNVVTLGIILAGVCADYQLGINHQAQDVDKSQNHLKSSTPEEVKRQLLQKPERPHILRKYPIYTEKEIPATPSTQAKDPGPENQGETTEESVVQITAPEAINQTFVGTANSTTNATEKVYMGKKCSSKRYVPKGYCQKYFTCDRKLRREVLHSCSKGLFWNPDHNSIHGGVCDYLRNIENETLYQYKRDPNCVLDVAYFRTEGQCSEKYFYNHPTLTNGTETLETCPKGLLWSKEMESCDRCHLLTNAEGRPCCSPPENDEDD